MHVCISMAMMAVVSAFALAACAAVDSRLAKPFIEHDHFGTPDWKATYSVKAHLPTTRAIHGGDKKWET